MVRTSSIILVLFLLAACTDHRHDYRLLVPAAQFDQEIAEELVAAFEQNSGHRITLVPIPDGVDAPLDAIEAGIADLAFASNAQSFRQGVATVMPLYPTVLHIFYKTDRDPTSIRTLFDGARVYAGPAGSASHQLMTEVLASMDLEETEISFGSDPSELHDVVVIYMPISPRQIVARLEEIEAIAGYDLLSFGLPSEINTGSLVDRAVLLDPRLSPFVIPIGTYGDIPSEPVVTLAVDKLLVANPKVPDAEIYDLIGEIRRLQPALSEKRPMLFRQLSHEFDAADSTFVLHSGAHSFTQRDAPDVYERYSGVAEVLVTLVIGLISGIYAVVQIYNRRRKNRIDAFYTDVMALRDSITDDSSLSDRESVVEKVRNLQNEAFDMLVKEKLAADESFRIFVTLSNDIIADLRKPTV